MKLHHLLPLTLLTALSLVAQTKPSTDQIAAPGVTANSFLAVAIDTNGKPILVPADLPTGWTSEYDPATKRLKLTPPPAPGGAIPDDQREVLQIPAGGTAAVTFTLKQVPSRGSILEVYKNGILMALGIDYAFNFQQTVTYLASKPAGGDIWQFKYR